MKRILLIIVLWSAPLLLLAQRKAIPQSVMRTGQAIYTNRCLTCHQADGSGAQNMIPPLIRTDFVLGDQHRLIGIILNGLKGELKINGDMYAGEMPAHSDLRC